MFPTILDRYVRTGKVQLELRLLRFIGPDSDRLARVAVAAAAQNRMWQFAELAYLRQGTENSGYATDDFINRLAADAGLEDGRGHAAERQVRQARAGRPHARHRFDAGLPDRPDGRSVAALPAERSHSRRVHPADPQELKG